MDFDDVVVPVSGVATPTTASASLGASVVASAATWAASATGLSTSNSTLVAPLVALGGEVDPETCQLLGPVALVVQALMGVIVVLSLVLKRAQEKPRRKWRVWIADVSKQVVGQAFVHMSNVVISDLIASHKMDNPCSLYALNILIDTTIGVFVLWIFLKLSTSVMLQYQPDFRSGDYGEPFSINAWAQQAAIYVACLSAMKVVVLIIFWMFPVLFVAANWCLSWIESDDAQVVLVMLVFPLVMNVFQFLVVDSLIKSKAPTSSAFVDIRAAEDEESRRGFLERGSDDHDDDEAGHGRMPADSSIARDATFSSEQHQGASNLARQEGSKGARSKTEPNLSTRLSDSSDDWPALSDTSFDSPRIPQDQDSYPPTQVSSKPREENTLQAFPKPDVSMAPPPAYAAVTRPNQSAVIQSEAGEGDKAMLADEVDEDDWGVSWSDDEELKATITHDAERATIEEDELTEKAWALTTASDIERPYEH
ncbi:hypothetical protein OIO90_002637 [Microbotryomycetes sp. JL221]|nr:hypothetical protein OIO90_002637 [Microbotryomycetes sp. JL221]